MNMLKLFLFGLIVAGILGGCIQKIPRQTSPTDKTILPAANQSITRQNIKAKTNDRQAGEKQIPARLIRIIDGDTLEVSLGNETERVRLLGIDAPESSNPSMPVQCFGIESKEQLQKFFPGKKIFLKKDSRAPDRDRYGRLLRYVYNENNIFINLEMIKNGYAFAYTPGALEYFSDFRYYEKRARDANLGLWNASSCPYRTGYQ